MFGRKGPVSRRKYDRAVDQTNSLRARLDEVLVLHQRADKPTRHWEPCSKHVGTPENRREHGGWIPLTTAMELCSDCTFTDLYHCTYDSHVECGHEGYPCATARAARDGGDRD
jgi:hypothetical protein